MCFGLSVCASEGRAQADYRNLDTGRPIAVEDAQPIEFHAFEAQFGIPRFSREGRGRWSFGFEPELKWGILKDTQIGYSSEAVVSHDSQNTVFVGRDQQLHRPCASIESSGPRSNGMALTLHRENNRMRMKDLTLPLLLWATLAVPLRGADNLRLNQRLDYSSDSQDGPLITGDNMKDGAVAGQPNYIIFYGEG
jgi:hypothetical protein